MFHKKTGSRGFQKVTLQKQPAVHPQKNANTEQATQTTSGYKKLQAGEMFPKISESKGISGFKGDQQYLKSVAIPAHVPRKDRTAGC